MSSLDQVPADFLFALGTLRQARCRSELHLDEIPAPSRLAPFAVALGAEVIGPGDSPAGGPVHGPAAAALARASGSDDVELATGRFILLHDPDGSAVWDGEFRIVTYIRAQLEAEMGNDESSSGSGSEVFGRHTALVLPMRKPAGLPTQGL